MSLAPEELLEWSNEVRDIMSNDDGNINVPSIIADWIRSASDQDRDFFGSAPPDDDDKTAATTYDISPDNALVSVSDDTDHLGRRTMVHADGATVTCRTAKGLRLAGKATIDTAEWSATGTFGPDGKLNGWGRIVCHLSGTVTVGHLKSGVVRGFSRMFKGTGHQEILLFAGRFRNGEADLGNGWSFAEGGGAFYRLLS